MKPSVSQGDGNCGILNRENYADLCEIRYPIHRSTYQFMK